MKKRRKIPSSSKDFLAVQSMRAKRIESDRKNALSKARSILTDANGCAWLLLRALKREGMPLGRIARTRAIKKLEKIRHQNSLAMLLWIDIKCLSQKIFEVECEDQPVRKLIAVTDSTQWQIQNIYSLKIHPILYGYSFT